jgi:hypothetical protein
MTTSIESLDALRLTLRAARENETRWLEMSPESTADIERIEQWASIAKLRRLEVERIEMILAEMAETESSSQPQSI